MKAARRKQRAKTKRAQYDMRLYVIGQTPKSRAALTNLKRLCKTHLDGQYRIEVIDLLRHPQRASEDEILAIPTLVRRLPTPIRKIIGDLSQTERVLVALNVSRQGGNSD